MSQGLAGMPVLTTDLSSTFKVRVLTSQEMSQREEMRAKRERKSGEDSVEKELKRIDRPAALQNPSSNSI